MQCFTQITLLSSIGLLFLSCDQTTVHFPEDSLTGAVCGPWYPAGADPDDGQEYAIEEDATFPCLVWESVRQNQADTWLNIGDLYLSIKHGEISAKALVVAKVGISCAGCYNLIVELAGAGEKLESKAVMLALTHGDVFYPEFFPLDEAEAIIVGQDGWPEGWYLTNDVENHFSESQFIGIPWVTVVDLKNMRVISSSNSQFSAANVDELVTLIEGL